MTSGSIVWLDFRRDSVPKEANKLRPAIIVEDRSLFAAEFPNVVVVPCTTRLTYEIPALCVRIEPDERNGFDLTNWAVAHSVTTASKSRIVKTTDYRVSTRSLAEIRARIVELLGASGV
ncbi:MAG: type II toxin-antitoxin system PemK/MazF family toxin [Candidatus Eremiobacteraeota bacterium]|nr:type II toxin-antitoxin system PemK/MazF family toxin [Candidatus Eremiobacteraeota bacterium]